MAENQYSLTSIGGYFEIAEKEVGIFPHKKGLLLNTGRNALECILRSLGYIRHIYLPYYTCRVVLEPLIKLSIPWSYYPIDFNFEIARGIDLHDGEYIIANNYFGIKDAYLHQIAKFYKGRLIADCAQALFCMPIPKIQEFYSCRKFVGVADGGVAYLNNPTISCTYPKDNSTSNHDSHLYIRKRFGAETGFKYYQDNERKLDNQPVMYMSEKTKSILDCIDYDGIIRKRRNNWIQLHKQLQKFNELVLPSPYEFACPMAYPFLVRNGKALREKLISKRIYIAKYWPNINCTDDFKRESYLLENLVPIPCDQRMTQTDIERIIEIIL